MTIIKVNEETVHNGPRFAVKRADFLRPDGVAVKREWIEPGDAVAGLPYSIDQDYLIMARQPREITGRTVLSLCAGQIDAGESPGLAAERELGEELGLKVAGFLDLVGVYYSSEGITDEKTYIFLAEDAVEDLAAEIDEEEAVTAERFKLTDLPLLIEECDNAKAAIALQALQIRLIRRAARDAVLAVERIAQ